MVSIYDSQMCNNFGKRTAWIFNLAGERAALTSARHQLRAPNSYISARAEKREGRERRRRNKNTEIFGWKRADNEVKTIDGNE